MNSTELFSLNSGGKELLFEVERENTFMHLEHCDVSFTILFGSIHNEECWVFCLTLNYFKAQKGKKNKVWYHSV